MAKTVVGLFDNYSQGQSACDELVRQGFGRDDITMVTAGNATTRSGMRTPAERPLE